MALPSPPAGPLSGCRVLVTRSADRADELCARLEALGAEAIRLPAIRIVPLSPAPLDEALEHLDGYDWLVFTSRNAVHRFLDIVDRSDRGSVRPGRAALVRSVLASGGGGPRVAAVGSATRDLLFECGIIVDTVPRRHTGADLVIAMGVQPGQRVLLPRAKDGRPEIVDGLRARGALVDDIPVYETRRAEPQATALAALAAADRLDAVVFTSPSAVGNTLAMLGDAASDRLSDLIRQAVVACIGPSTAVAATDAGLDVAVQPERFTIEDLVSALAIHMMYKGARVV